MQIFENFKHYLANHWGLVDQYWDLALNAFLVYLPRIVLAILVWVIGFKLIKIVANFFDKLLVKQHVSLAARSFLNSFLSIVLKVLVLVSVASSLGVPITSFMAILGAAGLAVGLALQGSLSNFAGGLIILIFKPFKIGDYVSTSSHSGTVEKITIFNTTLITVDNKAIVIPNGDLSNKEITNFTAKKIRRIDLVFGVGYESDIKKVREILMGLLQADKRILADPAPQVLVGKLGDSSVDFYARPWCKTEDYWDIYFDLTEKAKLAFDENGISIPFPQMDVHLKKDEKTVLC